MNNKQTILAITGSDGTGGSGVQADIRCISELGGVKVDLRIFYIHPQASPFPKNRTARFRHFRTLQRFFATRPLSQRLVLPLSLACSVSPVRP